MNSSSGQPSVDALASRLLSNSNAGPRSVSWSLTRHDVRNRDVLESQKVMKSEMVIEVPGFPVEVF